MKKRSSRLLRQGWRLYLVVLSAVWISFSNLSVGLAEFAPQGVGTESVDIVNHGSLTWKQLAEVDEVRLGNLAKSEFVQTLFAKTFELHGVFGEKQTGEIERDWTDLSSEIGANGAESREVYRLWREHQSQKIEDLGAGNEDAWNDLFEKKSDPKNAGKSWEQFAKENGLIGAGLALSTMFLYWKRRKEEEEVKDYGFDETNKTVVENIWRERNNNDLNSILVTISEIFTKDSRKKIQDAVKKRNLRVPIKPQKSKDYLLYETLDTRFTNWDYSSYYYYKINPEKMSENWIENIEKMSQSVAHSRSIDSSRREYLIGSINNRKKYLYKDFLSSSAKYKISDTQKNRIQKFLNTDTEAEIKKYEKIMNAPKLYRSQISEYNRSYNSYISQKTAIDRKFKNEEQTLYKKARTFFQDKFKNFTQKQEAQNKLKNGIKSTGRQIIQNVTNKNNELKNNFETVLGSVVSRLNKIQLEKILSGDRNIVGLNLENTATTNKVLDYLSNLKNYTHLNHFADIEANLKTIATFKESKTDILLTANVSKTDLEISRLKSELSQSNKVSYDEYLLRDISSDELVARKQNSYQYRVDKKFYERHKQEQFLMNPYSSGVSTQLSKEYQYNVVQARGNFGQSQIDKIKMMEAQKHQQIMDQYQGWGKYFKKNPLARAAEDEQKKARIDQLEKSKKNLLEVRDAQLSVINKKIQVAKGNMYDNFAWINSTKEARSKNVLTDKVVTMELEAEGHSSSIQESAENFIENIQSSLANSLHTEKLSTNEYPPLSDWTKSSYSLTAATIEQHRKWNTPEGQAKRESIYNRPGDPDGGGMETGKQYRRAPIINSEGSVVTDISGKITYKYVEIDKDGKDVNPSTGSATVATSKTAAQLKTEWLAERKAKNYLTQIEAGDLMVPAALIKDEQGHELTGKSLTEKIDELLANKKAHFRSVTEPVLVTSPVGGIETEDETVDKAAVIKEAARIVEETKAKQAAVAAQTEADLIAEIAAIKEDVLSAGPRIDVPVEIVELEKRWKSIDANSIWEKIRRGELEAAHVSETDLETYLPFVKQRINEIVVNRPWWDKMLGRNIPDEQEKLQSFWNRGQSILQGVGVEINDLEFAEGFVVGVLKEVGEIGSIVLDAPDIVEGVKELWPLLQTEEGRNGLVEALKEEGISWAEDQKNTIIYGTSKEKGTLLAKQFLLILEVATAVKGGAKLVTKLKTIGTKAKNIASALKAAGILASAKKLKGWVAKLDDLFISGQQSFDKFLYHLQGAPEFVQGLNIDDLIANKEYGKLFDKLNGNLDDIIRKTDDAEYRDLLGQVKQKFTNFKQSFGNAVGGGGAAKSIAEIQNIIKTVDLRGKTIFGKNGKSLKIPDNWDRVRVDGNGGGYRYVNPEKSVQIRVMEKGIWDTQMHEFEKPYFRVESLNKPIKQLDFNFNEVLDKSHNATHYLINNIK